MDINISLEGMNRFMDMIDVDIEPALEEAVKETSEFLDNESTAKINRRIYQKPPSPNYRRTGRALGGHDIKYIDRRSRRVVRDTRIKGAPYDYAVFLNKNRRIRKLNTLFWDDSVTEARERAPRILKENILKQINAK